MRVGKKGEKKTASMWGYNVDKCHLGYQCVSNETLQASLVDEAQALGEIGPIFKECDPRKGPLFAIIEAVLEYNKKEGQELNG